MKIQEISEDQIILLAGLGAALTAYGVSRGAADVKDTLFEGLEDVTEQVMDSSGNVIETITNQVPKPKNPVAQVGRLLGSGRKGGIL